MSQEVTALATLKQSLEQVSVKQKLAEVAPKYLNVERVIRLMLAAASRNPKLAECNKESVLLFCMKCAETGLEPIGAGGAWPVPYFNGKTKQMEMQFIPDYRGLINAAKKAECIKDAWAEVVKTEDEFVYELGMNPTLIHKPARGDRGELEAAYLVIVMPDDTRRFVVMDKSEIEGIKKRSKAANMGPWVTDEAEMWKKTVTRRGVKPFAGASSSLNAAIEADNAASGVKLDREPVAMPKEKVVEAVVSEAKAPTADPAEKAPATPAPEQPAAPEQDEKAHKIKAIDSLRKGKGNTYKRIMADMLLEPTVDLATLPLESLDEIYGLLKV